MYSTSSKTYTYAQKRDAALKNSICCNIKWNAKDTDLETFVNAVKDGHAITHIFKKSRRLKDNYICSSFVSLDIDGCPISMEDSLERLEKKPTMCYYTASNGYKQGGYRYRFIYVFEDIIDKSHYMPLVVAVNDHIKTCVDGYSNTDDCSERLNQFYFGCDKSETDLIVTYNTYHLSDFPHEPQKPQQEMGAVKHTDAPQLRAIIPNTNFFNDFKTMKPFDFLKKYADTFQVQDHSAPIDYKYGAEIFDKERYMEVFRGLEKSTSRDGKTYMKVKTLYDGERRRKHLFADACLFRRINPTITLDELVYSLMNEIYNVGKYSNEDGLLDVYGIANYVINLPFDTLEKYDYKGKRHGYKVDKEYCKANNLNPKSYAKTVGKEIRKEKVMSLYDHNKTLKDNVIEFEKNGIRISIKTLRRYINEEILKVDNETNNISTHTIKPHCPIPENMKKRFTDEEIGELYDLSLSVKENLELLTAEGYRMGKDRLYAFCKRHDINTNPKKE